MKALIHIGIPKSGTSSIQAFLALNRDALAAQGVLYARFNPTHGSQFELPVTALEACGDTVGPELERRRLGFASRADQSTYVARYRDFLDRRLQTAIQPLFIASSEHIHAWIDTPERIAALDAFLRQRFTEVQYLVYLRPQDELIASSYSEAVRRGASYDFQTHLTKYNRLNHWQRLKPWRAVVGRSRLSVRLTCRDALAGGALVADFCTAAGIELAGLRIPKRANTALSQGELALRRYLNRQLPVLGRDGRLHPLYRLALLTLRPVAALRSDKLQLSPAERAAILAEHQFGNEKIRRRFFADRARLF
ncbi:MAG: hypothetical protein EA339_11000 [Rhodobacteraceae bacterium]|nr:MAG: hypothetical protein EA339_11000 [Paracoccaceae bacterium]